MFNKKSYLLTLLLALVFSFSAKAQDVASGAEVIPVHFPHSCYFTALSDNGLWAVASGNDDENQALNAYPYLVNATTGELTQLWTGNNFSGMTATDVTDDGKIVVGSTPTGPAYYDVDAGQWIQLPGAGAPTAVTPDGSRIVGWSSGGSFGVDDYSEQPVVWDRQADGTYLCRDVYAEFPDFPRADKSGHLTGIVRIENMSADGNILAGAINFITPATACYYVYDCTTHETRYIDNYMEGTASGSFVDQSNMSNNGAYITGIANVVIGSDEYIASYNFNIAEDKFELYNQYSDELDRGGFAVSNQGVVFASSPAVNPLRYVYVRVGKLWYGLDEIMSGRYGINIYDRIGTETTGTATDVADDGRVLIGMGMTKGDGYIIRLPETFSEAASHIDPFGAYAINPEAGSQFARFRTATIRFSKPVNLSSSTAQALFLDSDGKEQRRFTLTANADGMSFNVGGMPFPMTAGETYTLRFPAGTFVLAADDSFTNSEINVNYVGREATPAEAINITPYDSSNVSEISTNNPVRMTFDMNVQVADDADGNPMVGYLYEVGNDTPLCELTIAAQNNAVVMAPALRRYLRLGTDYRVVMPAGSVTDIMGDCANEEISVTYHGIFEQQPSQDNANLYFDDFDDPSTSIATYLLYEGDHNTPSTAMQQWEFDTDNSPWNFTIRDDENSTDYCAASHSMYSPAGKSDDWMSLPQLIIENPDYYLSFSAQSYQFGKNDVLKVVVLEDENGYTNFTSDLRQKFEDNGKVIFEQQLSPGSSAESLAGDWQHYEVSLADFSGKSVYIAFVNQNENQSAIFLDSVRVYYRGDFYLNNTTTSTVVNQESTKVTASVNITGDDVYNDLTATLTGAEGFTSTYTATGLNLTKNSAAYRFEFPDELPLTVGNENNYTISINLDGNQLSQSGTVKNLAFQTTKRVVIEKATGTECGYCPSGILAFENLESLFGDQFIPVEIHSNLMGADPYAMDNYVSYLGATALPTGLVNRIDSIYSPMVTLADAESGFELYYSFNSPAGNETFLDIVQREFELNPNPDADVTLTSAVCDPDSRQLTIAGNVNYAVNLSSLNQNIVFVVLENGLTGRQHNNYAANDDPLLGEWGAGGAYGQTYANCTYDHVARRVVNDSYGGVSGLIPFSVTAGEPVGFSFNVPMYDNVYNWTNAELVAMLVDNNTGLVINSTVVPFTVNASAGIGSAEADGGVSISTSGSTVTVTSAADVNVTVTALNGGLAGMASGSGNVSIDVNGGKGIYVVKATTADTTTVKKVILK